MMEGQKDSEPTASPPSGANNVISRHGFGFQYAVVKEVTRIFALRSDWELEVAEFPVRVEGRDTRADLVIRYLGVPTLLVAECKRANPALSHWMFAKAPYVHRGQLPNEIVVETVQRSIAAPIISAACRWVGTASVFGIYDEAKSNRTGDPDGKGRGAIEEALSQVMTSMNGLVNLFNERPGLIDAKKTTTLVPVIFTTANLWITDKDVGAADLKTGNLDLGSSDWKVTPWVALNYHLSPGIQHEASHVRLESLSEVLRAEFIRTVFVVGPTGIEAFLEWASKCVMTGLRKL